MSINSFPYTAVDLLVEAKREQLHDFLKLNAQKVVSSPVDTNCAITGERILEGELVFPWVKEKSFNDAWSCYKYYLPYIKSKVAFSISSSILTEISTGYFVSGTSAFKVTKSAQLAEVLTSVKEFPFALAVGCKKSQHLIWRTPVNYDANHVTVKVGSKDVEINVSNSVEFFKKALDYLSGKKFKGKSKIESLFYFSRNSTEKLLDGYLGQVDYALLNHLRLNPDDVELKSLIDEANRLSFGDKWMVALLSQHPNVSSL